MVAKKKKASKKKGTSENAEKFSYPWIISESFIRFKRTTTGEERRELVLAISRSMEFANKRHEFNFESCKTNIDKRKQCKLEDKQYNLV